MGSWRASGGRTQYTETPLRMLPRPHQKRVSVIAGDSDTAHDTLCGSSIHFPVISLKIFLVFSFKVSIYCFYDISGSVLDMVEDFLELEAHHTHGEHYQSRGEKYGDDYGGVAGEEFPGMQKF